MSDFGKRETDSYKKEIMDTLQKLIKGLPAYKEFVYFVKCVGNHYLTAFEKENPDIVVIDSDIPEELVLVSGRMPYWVLGGSSFLTRI